MLKPLIWIGSSKKDLKAFPARVQDVMGFALIRAQQGAKHPRAKPLKEFTGASVIEVVDDYDGDTFRAVYTVSFADVIYVLHAFQKKARRNIATSKQDVALIKQRLKRAETDYAKRTHEQTKRND